MKHRRNFEFRILNFELRPNALILNSVIKNSMPIDSAQGPEFIEGKIRNWKLEITKSGGFC
ncbi:hypothetical protein A3A71_02195 [Candidatus Berkelbacteria bacterium RIFCSPLOWO2_01_FULL_50_28]|uniref:Uncharacterized protein n=1 Tax=Candidatus Berkelbacteria bacterium RIFCSPLOWO2_01_FULL_50_28 TaxID=1797471 RepID=A0A1F5EC91_9BACT|nr:MAG: hypothetical protein A2807_00590 [Candidatus Berkelbacteria bacterium RIFCSPHIGHO2_01_FULL_50_36]OGD62192.1 MAG: hypothetical protein A3F39_00610 [Candidatus Berkelbacteria bacterium RIFCSPHIGHO2_12_FULL_50_11]OGD64834.1 MAG: hypothetical protein A3A71_02195 [Candidatus Berkelbacteria bacterium RIFCSPLOWO2_01_FULL_50_28]